jgi:hypothetical protein
MKSFEGFKRDFGYIEAWPSSFNIGPLSMQGLEESTFYDQDDDMVKLTKSVGLKPFLQ